MKKLHELRLERTESIRSMQAMVNLAGTEKRSFTETEEATYQALRTDVTGLDTQIGRAVELDTLNRSIEVPAEKVVKNTQRGNEKKVFNIATAMRQAATGALSGVAAEMNERSENDGVVATNKNTLLIPAEAISNRDLQVADGAALIHKDVATDLDIIVPVPLYKTLGVRILTGLNGTLGLPAQKHNEATFPGEGVDVITNPNQATGVVLTPQRVGLTESFSKELLNSGNSALFSAIISDMVAGIDSAITRRVISEAIDKAGAEVILTGAVTADAMTEAEAAIEVDGKFVFTRQDFALLKATTLDTGGLRTLVGGKFSGGLTFDGYDAFGTSFCSATNAIYGAWSHATVGMWDGIEIIVDPYSGAKRGEIEVTVNRLVDAQVRNTEGFAKITGIA